MQLLTEKNVLGADAERASDAERNIACGCGACCGCGAWSMNQALVFDMGVARIFLGGGTLFQKIFKKYSKNLLKNLVKNFLKIFKKLRKNSKKFSKNYKKFITKLSKNFPKNYKKFMRKFSKMFLRKLLKCIILAYFSKTLTNDALIFCAFGRKTQIVGNFEKIFENVQNFS